MKTIMIILSLTFAFSAFAKDCEKQVLKQFIEASQDYDYHSLSNKPVLHPAGEEGFESYGRYVELGYDFDVVSYTGSNEYMSGYGAYELIVNPKTCEIIKMQEVYAE